MLDDPGQLWSAIATSARRGDRLVADDLTEHLNRLRAQAGNPSVRELAKLTERQGSGRAMSRSTVQDKLSGKNPPRLVQILALVQACADYANSIGVSLSKDDTDEQTWRERTQATLASIPQPSSASMAARYLPAHEEDQAANPTPPWDLDPLIRAGMDDMVDLVQASESQPTCGWLPDLIEALRKARMSNERYLSTASKERPRDVAMTLLALSSDQEDAAVDRLMYLAAKNQPAESIPVILAQLRRNAELGAGNALADLLIDIMAGTRPSSGASPSMTLKTERFLAIVDALRSATMGRDVARLLAGIGTHGYPSRLLILAAACPDDAFGDRDSILRSVAKGGKNHILSVFKTLRSHAIDGIDPNLTRDRIIYGIPSGQYSEVASFLNSSDYEEEAARVLELENEVPF